MPELPEVENTRRYLREAGLVGHTFTRAEIGWAKTVQTPSAGEFIEGLIGGKVQEVTRRGKYILAGLEPGACSEAPSLILHLGMTGGLRVQPAEQPPHALVRHTFGLDDGTELRFQDGRKFGKLWLTDDPESVLPTLGPDPLTNEFTPAWLEENLAKRNAPVKALLLEQSIVSGMGNLYADESLFLSGIRPERPASEISAQECQRLREAIVAALPTALQKYDASRRQSWPAPPMGLSTCSIPRKAGEPCPRCGGPIAAIRVRARGTCYCPGCQE